MALPVQWAKLTEPARMTMLPRFQSNIGVFLPMQGKSCPYCTSFAQGRHISRVSKGTARPAVRPWSGGFRGRGQAEQSLFCRDSPRSGCPADRLKETPMHSGRQPATAGQKPITKAGHPPAICAHGPVCRRHARCCAAHSVLRPVQRRGRHFAAPFRIPAASGKAHPRPG